MASNEKDYETSDSSDDETTSQEKPEYSSKKLDLNSIPKTKKLTKKVETRAYWDPLFSTDWDAAGPPGHLASTRIKRDLSSLFKEPLPGIFAIPDERNLCLVHCLILGPFETPYEGGFFHFAVRFGPSYPIHPPRVRLMTTGGGEVRFNPNLYANGKVCLSILGTWTGPVWSPALNLGSLLLSIQSLLNDKPYFNEPGFKTEHYHGESDNYNLYLIHENLRVAICGQLESILNDSHKKQLLPSELADVMKESFMDFYDDYIETCKKNKHLDGQTVTDIFIVRKRGTYDFAGIQKRLESIKERLESLPKSGTDRSEKESSLSSISDEDDFAQEAKAAKVKAVIDEANDFAESEFHTAAAEEQYTIDDDIDLFADDEEEEGLDLTDQEKEG